MVFEFRLSDAEFRRAWLGEYFRRSRFAVLRMLCGPAIAWMGARMLAGAGGGGAAIGAIAILFGLWQLARPFALALVMTRRRRLGGAAGRSMRVAVEPAGIRISDGRAETKLDWNDVSAAGRGPSYVWFEVRRSSRATIPDRAIDDPKELIALFRARGKWEDGDRRPSAR